jgi:hypothetical protein
MDKTQRNEVEESGRRKCRSKQKEIHRNKWDWAGDDEMRRKKCRRR